MTKNDIYSSLIEAGREKGYCVIPEFALHSDCPPNLEERPKHIDLVWALRQSSNSNEQNLPNSRYWKVIAAFEIEGCNVKCERERHPKHLELLKKFYGAEVQLFMVLYTQAYDRNWNNQATRDGEIASQKSWCENICNAEGFKVISGIELLNNLQEIPKA
ncbi:hypothetical protein [Cellvibrio japonicus]|uniref:hypothetical protein n=1 Tax=Cellvibrio japonicus TaxID=155077 RepID=UPI0005A2EEF3|nr:hypothetical protein [Cellvibrio japonicus]QEI13466.1 hypothetical protein FY117_15360 [Cellvibrio japonicus]QEI17040.1 hypothetical protein FY116_15365 [Cellvibrio japonicus]QEI20618.1 hypothetical protein FY115_15360 [Cellvibrio japonicus]